MNYNKNDFVKLFNEMGIESTEDMFVLEPDTTLKKLHALEKRFNINTKTVLEINDIIGDGDNFFSEWTTLFYKYEAYGGSEEKINTVSNRKENLTLRLRDGLVPVMEAVGSIMQFDDNSTPAVACDNFDTRNKRGPFSPLLFLR